MIETIVSPVSRPFLGNLIINTGGISNMKKVLISMLAAAAMYTVFTGCEQEGEIPTTNALTTSVSVSATTTAVPGTTAAAPAATAAPADTTAANAAGGTTAVQTTTPEHTPATLQTTTAGIEALTDDALLELGATLFDKACKTTWDYYTGLGPFALVEENGSPVGQTLSGNRYGYRISDPAVQTLKDAKAAYHKIFSDRYVDDLDQVFLEQGGALYRCAGDRGANIFYVDTKLEKIIRRTNDEIYFTAVSHYADPDTGEKKPSKTNTFSMVYQNGSWLIGQFLLPY